MSHDPAEVSLQTVDLPVRRLSLRQLEWTHVVGVGAIHAGALGAFFAFSWSGLGVAAALWWIVGGLGTCLGYHRLLAHRSFRVARWLECVLAFFGSMSWEGSPIVWVGTHRMHHKHADREHDPHSPRHGLCWSHILWVFARSDAESRRARTFARDLERDPFMRQLDRYHFVPQFVLAAVLFAAGELWLGEGLSWVLWGVAARTVFTYHATWCVNSAAHRFGYRNYDTPDDSRNTWWVALVTFGEGWHNNHHVAPRSAAHGHRWFELDLTYVTIRAMAWMGLAHHVVEPHAALLDRDHATSTDATNP